MIKRLRHPHADWIREGNFVGAEWTVGDMNLEVVKDGRFWHLRFADSRRVCSERITVARFNNKVDAERFVEYFDYMTGKDW